MFVLFISLREKRKKKHQELKEYLLFLLYFSSEAKLTPPSFHPTNKAGCGILEMYLAVTLPEAFDSTGSLKEKKETELLLIVRKSWSNFSLGDYIIDTWGYVFHTGCPKNEARKVLFLNEKPKPGHLQKSKTTSKSQPGEQGTLEDRHPLWLQQCNCTSIQRQRCHSVSPTPGLWSHHPYCFKGNLWHIILWISEPGKSELEIICPIIFILLTDNAA